MKMEELQFVLKLLLSNSKGLLGAYMFGFGIMAGLLLYHYGLFMIFGMLYECECERVNLATYVETHKSEACLEFAEDDYIRQNKSLSWYLENGIGNI